MRSLSVVSAQRAKRNLSLRTNASIEVDQLCWSIDIYTMISPMNFEGLCTDMFKQMITPVERVLQDAKIDKGAINDVALLAGRHGFRRLSGILKDFFNGKEQNKSINPDEALRIALLSRRASSLVALTRRRTKSFFLKLGR